MPDGHARSASEVRQRATTVPVTATSLPANPRSGLSSFPPVVNRSDESGARATRLRVARHTERLDEIVRFYRDGLGLVEIGRFRAHDGYDGVFLEIPGSGTHLEFTAGGGHGAPVPHPESLLVFYLGDEQTVRTVVARLGVEPVTPANPYWAEHATAVADPDGFQVVLVPERWRA